MSQTTGTPPVTAPDPSPILRVRDLRIAFDHAAAPAVNGAWLDVHAGQMVALVGESGSGKSVTAMSLLGLLPSPPARIERGSALFRSASHVAHGRVVDLLTLDAAAMRLIRGREIAMIFQEPMTSLNPVMTIGDQIIETIQLHARIDRAAARTRAAVALSEVGIADAARRLGQYPHEFSGGMRQRVMIAMALACRPSLLLADEPTTALDVSVQAQILDLLGEARRTRGMGLLFITHDLGIVAQHADVVCVMYAGRIVEAATVFDLFDAPRHPYTRALLQCVPRLGVRAERLSNVHEAIHAADGPAAIPGHGALAWWPSQRPRGLAAVSGDDSVMVQAAPGHWARAWRTPDIVIEGPSLPAFVRGGAPAKEGEPCAS